MVVDALVHLTPGLTIHLRHRHLLHPDVILRLTILTTLAVAPPHRRHLSIVLNRMQRPGGLIMVQGQAGVQILVRPQLWPKEEGRPRHLRRRPAGLGNGHEIGAARTNATRD